MAKVYIDNGISREIQKDEGTADQRVVLFAYTTGKTIASIDVSKAGAQFADGTSTCAEINDKAAGGSGIYKLDLSAADVDTLGPLGIEMNDSTDEIYLEGVRIVTHDPYLDIAAILDDTGTNGVAIAADGITNAKIADDAFGAEHYAADWLEAAGIKADAFTAAKFATDSMTADALAADWVVEIAAGVTVGSTNKVYTATINRDEAIAANRTLYFYAEGTLPAKASMSTNGATFADSTAAPATITGNWRKLVLTKAEVATEGRIIINITTTVTEYIVTIVVGVIIETGGEDPVRAAMRAGRTA